MKQQATWRMAGVDLLIEDREMDLLVGEFGSLLTEREGGSGQPEIRQYCGPGAKLAGCYGG